MSQSTASRKTLFVICLVLLLPAFLLVGVNWQSRQPGRNEPLPNKTPVAHEVYDCGPNFIRPQVDDTPPLLTIEEAIAPPETLANHHEESILHPEYCTVGKEDVHPANEVERPPTRENYQHWTARLNAVDEEIDRVLQETDQKEEPS